MIYCFSSYRSYDSPKLVDYLDGLNVIEIAAGSSHSAAIVSEGDLYTWGLGKYGRLGHGDTETQLKPKMVWYRFALQKLPSVLLLYYIVKFVKCHCTAIVVVTSCLKSEFFQFDFYSDVFSHQKISSFETFD